MAERGQIFISHTHADKALAEALQGLVKALFGDQVLVNFSTNKELEGGIRAGQDWYRWIIEKVRDCHVALILLTPASVQKPWILWESGAVYGAAEATRPADRDVTKVRPLVFQLASSEVPSPFQRLQTLQGDDMRAMEQLMSEMLESDFAFLLSKAQTIQAARKLEGELELYAERVAKALLDAPLTVTEAAVQEWLERIDALEKQGRSSELANLHGWLRVAFGRDTNGQEDEHAALGKQAERPLDLRIHRRLGEIYQTAKDTKRAIAEFELARRLAPRDLFLLRRLGQAYLDDGDRDAAKHVIDRIRVLDAGAFTTNQESAALEGRWFMDGNRFEDAAKVYEGALGANPKSYYLYDLLGQAYLRARKKDRAQDAYRQALAILGELGEKNVWTRATAATAAIVCDDEKTALEQLRALAALRPSAKSIDSIERGLRNVQESLGLETGAFERFRNALRA